MFCLASGSTAEVVVVVLVEEFCFAVGNGVGTEDRSVGEEEAVGLRLAVIFEPDIRFDIGDRC